ncbi:hypothetical protein M9H77_35811 [Catharanthus roseus]|uniref:Uncharacterized protein n=1 Tax=Catharanthus roseus TaxID=4058 RepID=A0ACB9ZQ21_CATRO|nr:hypothetical protein M9H77_35811 [Catharanthus roseus]
MLDTRNSTVPVSLESNLGGTCKTDKENQMKLAKIRLDRFQNRTTNTEKRTIGFCVKEGNQDIRTQKTDDKEQNRTTSFAIISESRSKPS